MMHKRIEGIDYIRAVMSVFVVVWHMGGGGRSLIFSKDKYLEHVFTLSDFVIFHVLLLAVPSFIFVSMFLYTLRGVNNTNFKKRLRRILILLTFWPIALLIFTNGFYKLIYLFPHSLSSFAITVLSAGNTPYYFFVSLLVCFLMTHLIAKLKRWAQILGFVSSAIFLVCLPELSRTSGYYSLSAYWNPLNFIPLPFAAVIVAQNIDYVRSKMTLLVSVSLTLSVLFSIIEWNYSVDANLFLSQAFAIPAYTRASLLFCVIALAILATDPRIKSIGISKYMAKYSLALYCVHPFLIEPVRILVATITKNEMILIYSSIILVMLFSYAIAMILRTYLKEEVIM